MVLWIYTLQKCQVEVASEARFIIQQICDYHVKYSYFWYLFELRAYIF